MDFSRIYLRKNSDSSIVEAELWDGVGPSHLGDWERTWKPIMDAQMKSRETAPCEQDAHWDWRRKHLATRRFLTNRWFTVTCEASLQGLMLVDLSESCRLSSQFGKPLVYVAFISTAPWNRPSIESQPRFSGVGRSLILQAIELSLAEGFEGRVGLHALSGATEFYEGKCGMTVVGQDAAKDNLTYIEMTPEQAEAFRRN